VWFITTDNVLGILRFDDDLRRPFREEMLQDLRKEGGTFSDICVRGEKVWVANTTSGVTVWDAVKEKMIKSFSRDLCVECLLPVGKYIWAGTLLGPILFDAEKIKTCKGIHGAKGFDNPLSDDGTTARRVREESIKQLVSVGNSVWCLSSTFISVWNAGTGYFDNVIPITNVTCMAVIDHDVWVLLKDCTIKVYSSYTLGVRETIKPPDVENIPSFIVPAKCNDLWAMWLGSKNFHMLVFSTGKKVHTFNHKECFGKCPICDKGFKGGKEEAIRCDKCGLAIHRKCYPKLPYFSVCEALKLKQ